MDSREADRVMREALGGARKAGDAVSQFSLSMALAAGGRSRAIDRKSVSSFHNSMRVNECARMSRRGWQRCLRGVGFVRRESSRQRCVPGLTQTFPRLPSTLRATQQTSEAHIDVGNIGVACQKITLRQLRQRRLRTPSLPRLATRVGSLKQRSE